METLIAFTGNYYGVDWAAMILMFLSMYYLGNRNRIGFVYGIGSNICWFIFGIMAGSLADPLAQIVVAGISIRGWWKWHAHVPLYPKHV